MPQGGNVTEMTSSGFEQLVKNWKINHQNTMTVLSNLHGDQLELRNRSKGRTIAQIMTHMVKNKFDWLQHIKPDVGKKVPDLDDINLELAEEFASSWILELIGKEREGQEVKGFKTDLFGFVIYLISHDSHHRGQIFQILRDQGSALSQELQYGIWDWS